MSNEPFFNDSATAQLVIEPFGDRIVGANREACRLFKMNIPEIQSVRPSRLFSASLPDLIVFTEELIEKGRGWCDHLRVRAAAGELRLEVNGLCAESGGERHLHLSLQKADELQRLRERSEAHLHYLSGIGHWNRVSRVFQEFERENQLLLDAAGEGIYGVDENGNTTFVNPAAERMLGYTAEDLAGRNMHAMVHHSHADGSAFHAENCPIFAAFRDGTVHTVEDDLFWTRSGRPIDVEYTSTPIRDNGIIVGAVVVFRDVSQKKTDRKRLLEALAEVETLKNRLELENTYLQEEINSAFNHHRIVGHSTVVRHVIQQIERVAPTDATVLVSGESGTGKELIARAIHEMSRRSQRSLIRVNCAAIPADLFESEFFGHAKGAFTGATHDRPGRFELAHEGTLFLDEVGEIPLHLQGKLLRVLQEQQFEKVGESKTRHVDVRIIAATNRDLKDQVQKGLFREDLYFRLNVFPIESAPLRQRQDDIPLLTQHFLKKICTRIHKPDLKIPLGELEKLKAYSWPGNIRELENVIERQAILAQSDTLRFDGLAASAAGSPKISVEVRAGGVLTDAELKRQDMDNLLTVLERCRGKIFGPEGAAELMGIKPTTLASRVKKYGIDLRRFKKKPAD